MSPAIEVLFSRAASFFLDCFFAQEIFVPTSSENDAPSFMDGTPQADYDELDRAALRVQETCGRPREPSDVDINKAGQGAARRPTPPSRV